MFTSYSSVFIDYTDTYRCKGATEEGTPTNYSPYKSDFSHHFLSNKPKKHAFIMKGKKMWYLLIWEENHN